MFPAITTIPAIVTIVNDHMETRLKDKCMDCSTPLISEDRTQKFMINDDFDFAEMFLTIYKTAQSTRISYDALKHASISGMSTITHRA